jgi:translation elongation factor EF-1alpha
MDSPKYPFSQKIYERIFKIISTYIKEISYKIDVLTFMEMSGWNDDNMLEPNSRNGKKPTKIVVPVKS